MDEAPPNESLARALVLGVACGRIAIGVGAFLAARRALGAAGFAEPSAASIALARLAGARDTALGLQALSVRDDRAALKQATAIGAAVDAGDAIAFGAALVTRAGIGRAAAIGAPIALAAAGAGLWGLRRL